MSGGIRKRLGLAKHRLLQALHGASTDLGVGEDLSKADTITALHDRQIALHKDTKRIRQYRATLSDLVESWDGVFTRLETDELAEEEQQYQQAADGDQGFLKILADSEDILLTFAALDDEIRFHLAKLNAPAVVPAPANDVPASRAGSPAPSVTSANPHSVNLPKLNLPVFRGEPLKWGAFWALFAANVDSLDIPEINKFGYLTSCLKDEAAAAIEGLAVEPGNYPEALDLLKKRFGRPEVIIESLYSKLRGLSISSKNVSVLQSGIDEMERILRQLQANKEEIEQAGTVHLLLGKMPRDVLTELEGMRQADETWTVKRLRDYLWNLVTKRARVERICEPEKKIVKSERVSEKLSSSSTGKPSEKGANSTPVSTFAAQQSRSENAGPKRPAKKPQKQNSQKFCVFCNQSGHFANCQVYSTLQSRVELLKSKCLCLKCAKTGSFCKPVY